MAIGATQNPDGTWEHCPVCGLERTPCQCQEFMEAGAREVLGKMKAIKKYWLNIEHPTVAAINTTYPLVTNDPIAAINAEYERLGLGEEN